MRTLSTYKKQKAVKLFFEGLAYDEVAEKLGISKGSMVSIIDDFRQGRLPLPPNITEYVDALRQLAVEMRKSNTGTAQLLSCLRIHSKLKKMGVGIEDTEDWLEVCQDIGSQSAQSSSFAQAALKLTRLKKEHGLGYEEALSQHEQKLGSLKEMGKELDGIKKKRDEASSGLDQVRKETTSAIENRKRQAEKLEAEQERCLSEHNLTWERIKLAETIFNSEASSAKLTGLQVKKLRERVGKACSLFKLVTRMTHRKQRLAAELKKIIEFEQFYSKKASESARLLNETDVKILKRVDEMGKLDSELESKKAELTSLEKETADKLENLYISHAILDFLHNPGRVSDHVFDRLVSMMLALRQERLGIGPKQVVDSNGEIICRCDVPKITTNLDKYDIDIDHARTAFGFLLAPLVRDKFVSRIEYDIAKMGYTMDKKLEVLKDDINQMQKT